MHTPQNESKYYPALTGVRALAAWAVYFHHYTPDATKVGDVIYSIAKELHVGVTLFFVLSGFLIHNRYADRVNLSYSFLVRYFSSRFSRIYPVFCVVVVLNCGYFTGQNYFSSGSFDWIILIKHIFLELTFLKGFSDNFKFIGVPPSWSLTVEETFYFLFPLIVVWLKHVSMRWIWLATVAIGFLLLLFGSWMNYHSFFSPWQFMVSYTFWGRATEFFIGMLLSVSMSNKKNVSQTNVGSWQTWSGIVGCFVGTYIISLFQDEGRSHGIFHVYGMATNNLFMPLAIGLLLKGLIFERSWLRFILSTKGMQLAGKASYVFYLIHVGFIYQIFYSWTQSNIVLFVAINVVSILVYLYFEKPCQYYISNKWI
jgi:peptidoglycan/LPS O-acetylase OafA/YrhL